MLKMPYTGCPGLSPAISPQYLLLKCVSQPEIAKNSPKSLFLGFKVIGVDTNKKLVTIACYNKQHVCAYLQPFLRYTT